MNKYGDKKLPHAYTGIKNSCDPTIAWLPIYVKFSPIGKFSLFAKFFLSQIFQLYDTTIDLPG